jgi:predicted nuclease of predicted toxin-antitoxin system
MSIKLLIDMNLSPDWVEIFTRKGWTAIHWSTVGGPQAEDSVIMEWARFHGYVIITHDLDFGTILALTYADGPSVIQVRTQDVFPTHLEKILFAALERYEALLESGVLIIVDEKNMRARILPIKS